LYVYAYIPSSCAKIPAHEASFVWLKFRQKDVPLDFISLHTKWWFNASRKQSPKYQQKSRPTCVQHYTIDVAHSLLWPYKKITCLINRCMLTLSSVIANFWHCIIYSRVVVNDTCVIRQACNMSYTWRSSTSNIYSRIDSVLGRVH